MVEVEKFLEKTKPFVDDDKKLEKDALTVIRQLRMDVAELKTFSSLLASSVESLNKLVNARESARDIKRQVLTLTEDVKKWQNKTAKLTGKINDLNVGFNSLEQKLIFEVESQSQRNKKLSGVLDGLEQYLRRHR